MKNTLQILCILALSLNLTPPAFSHTYDLNKQEVASLEQIIGELKQVRTVFIGEVHDQQAHHEAQLQLIKNLHESGAEIIIGLEMFRQDGQAELNQWIHEKIDEADFSIIFNQHWNRWNMYREIFLYAREEKIPMVGLNISREIVNQVARKGFVSLSEEQRKELPLVACDVSPEYQDFIRRALGGHGENGVAFKNFCEAQMLWDASMAKTLQSYLDKHPKSTLIVLAGNGHTWKHGIPEQLVRRGNYSNRVLLPEVPGRIDLQTIGPDDADYLLQGVEQAPLH